MTTLHGEPIYPGDKVWEEDTQEWGRVESVTCNEIYVTLKKRTKRRYSKDGFAPRACRPSLFWQPLPRIMFAKDNCKALEQAEFLQRTITMLNDMSKCDCNKITMEPYCNCGDSTGCGC